MWLYHVEHAFVMLVGFLVGVALAMCIAPGDIVLVLMAGIVLGFFARGFLDQNLGGAEHHFGATRRGHQAPLRKGALSRIHGGVHVSFI